MTNETTLERDPITKNLFVRVAYSYQDEPIGRVLSFRVVGARGGDVEAAVGAHITRRSRGVYGIDAGLSYDAFAANRTLEILVDPDREADYVSEFPIPAPTVRKGTETRYYYGEWQKYTKRNGWVTI